jgi:hypothetical protein
LLFCPKSRYKKTSTDALTRARMGLYRISTAYVHIRASVGSCGGICDL